MKATGIVRRIDDLGRIVIPKEIRRTLRIRETDPLEIFTDKEGEIILKKYSPIGELGAFAKEYAESLAQTTGHTVCVSDRDQIIAAAGPDKKDMIKKNITKKMEQLLEDGINAIGLGPQGMGGKYSVMGVNIETTARHPSTIGVAVNVGCWSHRRGHIVIDKDLNVVCDTHSTWKFE